MTKHRPERWFVWVMIGMDLVLIAICVVFWLFAERSANRNFTYCLAGLSLINIVATWYSYLRDAPKA